jgi:hypothetical protein
MIFHNVDSDLEFSYMKQIAYVTCEQRKHFPSVDVLLK